MTLPLVLTDPPRHPYVDRLDGLVARLVHRDLDPALRHDPDWIDRHARDVDIAHLHLGLTTASPDRLVDAVAAHRRRGVPVAITVHDLRTPDADGTCTEVVDLLQRIDRSVAAVVTLTSRCAATLHEALDRPVRVIPHGPILPRPARERLRAHRRVHSGGPLLLVAEDLPRHLGWLEAIEAATRTFTGRHLHILTDPAHASTVEQAAAGHPAVTVGTTSGVADEALHRAIADAAAVVLPWRWGGHSWVVELAADIGTPVVATDVGFLADQHPLITAGCSEGHIDVDELATAMDADLSTVVETDRDADEQAFRHGYERLYRQLMLGRDLPPRQISGQMAG